MSNEYGYNDKELWEDGEVNWLDYGFRNYDPQLGRFLQIDPLSDDYEDLSPYLYAYNDPIANVDEDGLFASSALNAVGKAVSANTLPEVIVKSTIKKAASKSIGKIILTKIAENSVSLFGSLINSGNNFVDKGKEIYNRVSLNIELEDARTGTTFGERFLKEAMSMENVFGGLEFAEFKIGRNIIKSGANELRGQTVGEIRIAGEKDAHHIIQDAAVKNIPGYSTTKAPGIKLDGPSYLKGTPHYKATQVQKPINGYKRGTYARERVIGYKALKAAGVPKDAAKAHIRNADKYFKSIGVDMNTITRIPKS